MQCASSTAESRRRHAVRRLTERHLGPGTSSTAAVTSTHTRRQHEVDRKRKYDGGVLFSGDLRHGLKVAQLQSVGRFVDDVRCLLERVRRFLLAFGRYDLHTMQTVGWIKMPLGTETGLGQGDIVLDGNPAPPW